MAVYFLCNTESAANRGAGPGFSFIMDSMLKQRRDTSHLFVSSCKKVHIRRFTKSRFWFTHRTVQLFSDCFPSGPSDVLFYSKYKI